MTSAVPDIDFHQIRPYGQPASRASGFEELASVLIEEGVAGWPSGVHFERFGNPDGGREGRGVLPNGDVWAWQAKYLFQFDASAAGEVTGSVRRVLGREPNLKRFLIAMPFDLPAGDTEGRTSAHTRWAQKVSEWEALAHEIALEVEFEFVGAHHLLTALTESRHAGRARYWFGAGVMTPEWQGRRLEDVIAKAGRRYTPKLNVDVEAMHALSAVGRGGDYVARWQQVLAELRKARGWGWRAPADLAEAFADSLAECAIALDLADVALAQMIVGSRSTEELPHIEATLESALQAVRRVSQLLQARAMSKDGYYVGDAASLYTYVREATGALNQGIDLSCAATTRAARDKVLLLIGRAGVGKTHLLCDASERRIAEGSPTVLLLGQDFDGRSLLSQIGELTQLGGSLDDALAVLDAAAEAAAGTGLFMIDALNESEQPERWRDDARALITAASHYPHVSVVLSCRTEFVGAVVGDQQLATFEHVGFAEATDVAIRRFTQEYGLEPSTFPILNPEFGNPLFLKLTCEALETLGATRFTFGIAGLKTVCDAFLEAVNKRLSEASRCDYDERSNFASRVVREVALLDRDRVDRSEVKRITEELLPDRPWSRSLMRGLIEEGVFLELGDGRMAFGYQRLGDVARADVIADKTPEEVRQWMQGLGGDLWRERGVLGALAVILPERHGLEVLDLAIDREGTVAYDAVDTFLESLLLRSPESVSPRTVEIVQRLLDRGHRVGEIWNCLIRVACVPGNPLNAEWLHTRLAAYGVAERDRLWSTWLVGATDTDDWTTVRRLIDWAWPADLQGRSPVPDDVAELATLLFGWLLTTSDRRVRDRATKAIVSVGERAPGAFAKALERFRGTNDPYVVERLAAAACGVVLRAQDADVAQRIADSFVKLGEGAWPLHLSTRDFVRRIFGEARTRGWSGPEALPPYGTQWPISTRPIAEIEALAGPPDYLYGSIWHSLSGMGDFGRYVLQTTLRHVVAEDEEALRHDAERAVFDRVLDLGWTPERFRDIDGRLGGRDGVVERVGKKYEWIAFNEIVGRIADNHAIKASWGDEEEQPYAYAEQLVWRDIDPTVLVRKPAVAPTRPRHWFSPSEARFPSGVTDEYPADMAGVPDPLDLIAVSDPNGAQWLVLACTPQWEQPQPPEIEALRAPRLSMWMQLHAYLVPLTEVTALCTWAQDKDWYGRWMPENGEGHNVLLGTHPDDLGWSPADGGVEWWDARSGGPQPAELVQCAGWYGGTGTSRDASAEEETRGYVPSRRLFDLLGLSRGIDFLWSDPSGGAVCDPSVAVGGPAALVMRRDLVPRLSDAGFTIFWTVLVGKELHRQDHPMPGDDYRWVTASASYILSADRIALAHARAVRCRPGPTTERELTWDVKRTS
jgi:hypothetical protein